MSYDYTDLTTGEDLYESDMTERFDSMFDEVHEMIRFGELFYVPSRVLYSVDPTAYRCAFLDWVDSEVQDGNYREYVDSPVCEDCEATLTQDDVTESLANYGRLVCPTCGDGDDDCEATGTTEEGVRLLCTEVGEHDEHTAKRFEHGDQGYRLVTIAGVTWDED